VNVPAAALWGFSEFFARLVVATNRLRSNWRSGRLGLRLEDFQAKWGCR